MEGRYNIGDLLAKISLEEVVQRLGILTERRGVTTLDAAGKAQTLV